VTDTDRNDVLLAIGATAVAVGVAVLTGVVLHVGGVSTGLRHLAVEIAFGGTLLVVVARAYTQHR
jgi:hypothetical protein